MHARRCDDEPANRRAVESVIAAPDAGEFLRSQRTGLDAPTRSGWAERDVQLAGYEWFTVQGPARPLHEPCSRIAKPAATPSGTTLYAYLHPSCRRDTRQPRAGAVACAIAESELAGAWRADLVARDGCAAQHCPCVEGALGLGAAEPQIHHLPYSPCCAGATKPPSAAPLAERIVVVSLLLISLVWFSLRDAYLQIGRSLPFLTLAGERIRTGGRPQHTHTHRGAWRPAFTCRGLTAGASSTFCRLSSASMAIMALLALQAVAPAAAQQPEFGVRCVCVCVRVSDEECVSVCVCVCVCACVCVV